MLCRTPGEGIDTGLRSGRILLVGNFGTTEAPVDESRMVPTGQISPYGFPVVAQHGRRLSHGECRALLSDDNGESWRTSVAIDVMDYCAGGCFTELSDDTVLLPVYGYRQGASEGEHCSNGFVCSTAGGETWSAPTPVAPWDEQLCDLPNEMGIVELNDGRWLAIYRNQLTRDDYNSMATFLYRSYSSDGGRMRSATTAAKPGTTRTCSGGRTRVWAATPAASGW